MPSKSYEPRTRRRLASRSGLLAAGLVLALAVPAGAATVSVAGERVRVVDVGAEANDVTLDWGSGAVATPVLTDVGAALTYDPGSCPANACPALQHPVYDLQVGAGDDRVQVVGVRAEGTVTFVHGGDGDDVLASGAGSDHLDGGPGDDLLIPDQGSHSPRDVVVGGTGTDVVDLSAYVGRKLFASLDGVPNDGARGELDNYLPDLETVIGAVNARNIVVGSETANTVQGGARADRLTGAGGKDRLDAGGGDDVVDALDGYGGDRVDCGDGVDTAYVDAGDAVLGCESLVWAPKVHGRRLTVRSGRVLLRVTCPQETTTCRGSVEADLAGDVLGRGDYRLRSGRTARVPMRLTRTGARQVQYNAKLRATLFVKPSGHRPVSGRKVTLTR